MKMKWLKREFAALTAAALTVVSLGVVPVSATTAAPHTRSYDFNTAAIADPASVTESDLTAIFGEEWQGYAWQKPIMVDQGASTGAKNTYRYDIVDKAFGKEPGDKAFRMWIDKNEKTNPDTDPMQKLMLTDGMDQNTNNAMVLKEGEYLDLSFDMAFSGEMGEKGLQAEYIGSFKNNGRRYPIITVTNGSEVKVLDQDVVNADGTKKVTLTQNSWYNFRLVMRAGDNSKTDDADKNCFWFYIDNQLVNEGTFQPKNDKGDSIDCFTGFNYYWFYQTAFAGAIPKTATTYSERNLYLDNLKFVSSKEQPTAEKWSKTMSFNALTPTDDITQAAYALADNPGYWNFAGTRYQFDTPENQKGAGVAIKSGMFGKPQEDSFVDLYNQVGNEGDPTRFYRLGNVTESGSGGSYATKNQTLCSKVENGDFYELEFYSAWEENTIKQVQGYYAGEIEKLSESDQWGGATGKAEIMWISQNGSVSVFGNGAPGISLLPNKWYKFNVVVQNTPDAEKKVPVTLYIDNQKVLEASFLPQVDNSPRRGSLKDNAFSGFYALNFNNLTLVAPDDAAYKNTEHHAYFDDITVTNHKNAAPVYTAPQLVTGSSTLQNYLGSNLYGYADNGVVYDSSWTLDGQPVTLYDANGNTVSSGTALTGSRYYFNATDTNGAALYGTLLNQSDTVLSLPFAQTADNTWYSDKLDGTNITDYFKQHATMKYMAGQGGKKADDYAANAVITNATTKDYNVYFQAPGKTGLNLTKDFHMSFDYREENGNTESNLALISATNNSLNPGREWNTFLKIKNGGISIPFDGNKTVGTYKAGQWMRIGFSVHPSTNTAEVYLDGKLVYNGKLFNLAGRPIERMKFEHIVFDETNGKSDVFGLDNIQITQGSRPDAGYQAADLVSTDNNVKVDNAAKTVTVKGDYDASVLSAGNAAIRLYTDSTMKNAAASLVNGGVAVVDDGTTLRYYTVTKKSDAPYTVDKFAFSMNGTEIENGKFTAGILSAKANLTVYDKDTKLSVITAQYKNDTNELIACELNDTLVLDGDVDSFNGTAATITASIKITETEETYVKAFLWNMENGDIIPISLTPIQLVAAATGEITNLALLYPGYANKAVTFSFDDGRPEDQKIIEDLYEPYGIHGTFNLNSNLQLLSNSANYDFVKTLYKDQEVASHVKNHPHIGLSNQPAAISVSTAEEYINLINEGISELNTITGQTVYGMAWPYDNPALLESNPMDEAKKVDAYVKSNDAIFYARGGKTTGSFDLPTSFKDWDFTAYCKDVAGLTDSFLALPDSGDLKVFSIWGHAYDLNENGNTGGLTNWVPNDTYRAIEQLIQGAKAQNVWFPTNIEFVKYVNALRALETTKTSVTNPSDTDVYLLVNYKPVKVAAGETFTPDEINMNQNPTVYLAGDSTCEIVPDTERPRTGWGEKLGDYLSVPVSDQAKAARSTKTFLNDIEFSAEGSAEYGMDRLGKILETAKSGDYLLIQFGHNDSMKDRVRYTTIDEYKANLKTFVDRARAQGVQPVFLTSIRLCVFENGEVKVQDGIESYRNAMKEVASELNVPLLDIGERWRSYLNTIGEEAAKQLYMVSYNGTDTTHPREEGAQLLAQMIAKEIKNSNAIGALSRYVK